MRLSSTVAIALVASTIGAMESARSQVPAQTEHCAGRPPGPGPSHPKGERWLRGGEVSEGPSGVAVKGGARLVVDGYDICADTLTS